MCAAGRVGRRALREPGVRSDLQKEIHGATLRPAKERPENAKACIDQFEFPDIPCEYPVVWVKAREAAEICPAEGKRLCDAHEWEGACEGELEPPDYRFDLAYGPGQRRRSDACGRAQSDGSARQALELWTDYQKGICASVSQKSRELQWRRLEQLRLEHNIRPAAFPSARARSASTTSNGNAAEHMNLPLNEEMASRGSRRWAYTEMKGSWFVFDRYHAHEDWCRWRAPYWHGIRVMDERATRTTTSDSVVAKR